MMSPEMREAVERLRQWAGRFDDKVRCPVGVGPDPHDLRLVLATLGAGEGGVLVPVEPTEAMLFAGGEQIVQQYCDNRDWEDAKDVIEGIDPSAIYRAMIAPRPEQGRGGGG